MMKRKTGKLVGLLLAVTVAASLAGCGNKEQGTVKIAAKPMTEQFILSEMLSLLIQENTDLKVDITKGVGGGTTNIHPALVKGEFDLYPEYTGTAWAFVVKEEEVPDDDAIYEGLLQAYDELGLTWTGLYGFNNTFALAVRGSIADQYKLTNYTELAEAAPELTFGANPDFYEKADGFPALLQGYGMAFKATADIDIGLKYTALESGEIDVTNAFTTDAQLAAADVKILEDDRKLFNNYYCGTVVRKDTLEKYPELQTALEKMNGLLTDQDMAQLNYKVEVEQQDEAVVAREFLQGKGLIK